MCHNYTDCGVRKIYESDGLNSFNSFPSTSPPGREVPTCCQAASV